MSSSSIAILGAGGHGRVVADAALLTSWDRVYVFDDQVVEKDHLWDYGGDLKSLLGSVGTFDSFMVALGNNLQRLEWHNLLISEGGTAATIIHPTATLSKHCTVAPGTFIAAAAVVAIGVELGNAVIVNTGATVDHDCVLGDAVHVSPGANLAGQVTVGEAAWVGIGSAVKERIVIGRGAVIGAGSVVLNDVNEGLVVAGVPARPIKQR